jgi:tetratricopeptide (TPR) repeat protein
MTNLSEIEFNQAKNYFLKGVEYYQQENYKASDFYLKKTLEIVPDRISVLINLCYTLIKLGNFIELEKIISYILIIDPSNDEVLFNSGSIFLEAKTLNFRKATNYFIKSLIINPANEFIYLNLGYVLTKLEEFKKAELMFSRASKINQDNNILKLINFYIEVNKLEEAEMVMNEIKIKFSKSGEACTVIANLNYKKNKFEDAINCYLKSIELGYKIYSSFLEIGKIYFEIEKKNEALFYLNKAINLNEHFFEGYINRGNVYRSLDDNERAISDYNTAIALNCHEAIGYYNLGLSLFDLKKIDQSILAYHRAIECDKLFKEAYYNLAISEYEHKHIIAAYSNYDTVISIDPSYVKAYNNKGHFHQEKLNINKALIEYNKALVIDKHNIDAHCNKSIALLLKGDLLNGFQEFEWRWKKAKKNPKQERLRQFKKPLWLGKESLLNKTILIHSEQGLGDTIQFCRYIDLVSKLGGNVIFEVQKQLLLVLDNLKGVNTLLPENIYEINYDYHCPLMSLPFVFKTTLKSIPNNIPYIRAKKEKKKYWEEKLSKDKKLKIGLVWSGGFRPDEPEHWEVNKRRNIPFYFIDGLFNENINFYSLQKGEPAETEFKRIVQSGENKLKIIDYSHELKDFTDTAGLIENLDLIISVDTSSAHLAGSMGKPVWLLNRYDSCWRWLLEGDKTPWYPKMKIFRQQKPNEWDTVIQEVNLNLRNLIYET